MESCSHEWFIRETADGLLRPLTRASCTCSVFYWQPPPGRPHALSFDSTGGWGGRRLPGSRWRAILTHRKRRKQKQTKKPSNIPSNYLFKALPRESDHKHRENQQEHSQPPTMLSPCFLISTRKTWTRWHSHQNETQRNLMYSASWKGKGFHWRTFPENPHLVLHRPKLLK